MNNTMTRGESLLIEHGWSHILPEDVWQDPISGKNYDLKQALKLLKEDMEIESAEEREFEERQLDIFEYYDYFRTVFPVLMQGREPKRIEDGWQHYYRGCRKMSLLLIAMEKQDSKGMLPVGFMSTDTIKATWFAAHINEMAHACNTDTETYKQYYYPPVKESIHRDFDPMAMAMILGYPVSESEGVITMWDSHATSKKIFDRVAPFVIWEFFRRQRVFV